MQAGTPTGSVGSNDPNNYELENLLTLLELIQSIKINMQLTFKIRKDLQ